MQPKKSKQHPFVNFNPIDGEGIRDQEAQTNTPARASLDPKIRNKKGQNWGVVEEGEGVINKAITHFLQNRRDKLLHKLEMEKIQKQIELAKVRAENGTGDDIVNKPFGNSTLQKHLDVISTWDSHIAKTNDPVRKAEYQEKRQFHVDKAKELGHTFEEEPEMERKEKLKKRLKEFVERLDELEGSFLKNKPLAKIKSINTGNPGGFVKKRVKPLKMTSESVSEDDQIQKLADQIANDYKLDKMDEAVVRVKTPKGNGYIRHFADLYDARKYYLKRLRSGYKVSIHESLALFNKAETHNVPYDTLCEVFKRGLDDYIADESIVDKTPSQHAFNRVNSYLAEGKAKEMDKDIPEVVEESSLMTTLKKAKRVVDKATGKGIQSRRVFRKASKKYVALQDKRSKDPEYNKSASSVKRGADLYDRRWKPGQNRLLGRKPK